MNRNKFKSELDAKMLSPGENDKSLREYAFLSQVADMYYNQGMLQAEIARNLYFSRSKVSRLLTQARELGIVDIKVKQITDRVPSLESALKKTFGIKDAVVISNFHSNTQEVSLPDVVADFASVYVSNLLRGNCIIGISNGRAVNRVTSRITKMHSCNLDIVQIIGSGSNVNQALESRDQVSRIQSIFPGSRTHFLNAPLYMDNAFAREQLLQDPTISDIFGLMKKCDIVLTGIGLFDPSRFLTTEIIREYQLEHHARELEEKGAVGSICAKYYDINGKYIDCEWNEKSITMPFEDVLANRMTVGVACGSNKILPILGALRAGLLNVLITNADTASTVLRTHTDGMSAFYEAQAQGSSEAYL